ncbi:MAG TPA: MFS transporter, partial [Telmatospirillum sp.]|nr:MFS transporter [Telmatospirillum sp.]
TVLLVTQSLALIESLALAVLMQADVLTPWLIVGLACLRGWISAFEHPARVALLADVSGDHRQLTRAVAADGLQINLARLLGPIMAGVILSRFGEATCFVMDGLSYVPALGALLALTVPHGQRPAARRALSNNLAECVRFVVREQRLHGALIMLAVTGLIGVTFTVLLPQYARDVLVSGPVGLARLICASGLGAIAATGIFVFYSKKYFVIIIIYNASTLYGVLISALCFVSCEFLAIICVALASIFIMLRVLATNILLQAVAPIEMRGCMGSLQSALFWGVMPFGSLLMGGLGQWTDPRHAYLIAGCCCVLAGLACRSMCASADRAAVTSRNNRTWLGAGAACLAWSRWRRERGVEAFRHPPDVT